MSPFYVSLVFLFSAVVADPTTPEPSCGFALEDLYLGSCPNANTLPFPGIQGPCESSSSLVENGGAITCGNSFGVMAIYGKTYDNTTQGWWIGNIIFCDPTNSLYWSVSSAWGKSYKFNPQEDKIVCLQNKTNMINEQFNLPAAQTAMEALVSVPGNCPDFTTLSFYTPSTSTGVPINSTLAGILSTGCTAASITRTPWFSSHNYPASSFTCQQSFFLVQGSNVIQLKTLLSQDPDFIAVAEDDSVINVDIENDYIFCTQYVDTDFACPSLTPTLDCPSSITEYTADQVPIPFFQTGLVPSPQCLQNYTILRSGYANNQITCYQPGTDLEGDKEESRLLILISDNGSYHLTRSLTCSSSILSMDEGYSYSLQPGATFTCVDALEAYDSLLLSQGIDPSANDYYV